MKKKTLLFILAFLAFWSLLFLGDPSNAEGGKKTSLSNTLKVSLKANLGKGKDHLLFHQLLKIMIFCSEAADKSAHLLAHLH